MVSNQDIQTTAREEAIYAMMDRLGCDGRVQITDITDDTNVSRGTARQTLISAEKSGILTRDGKGSYYFRPTPQMLQMCTSIIVQYDDQQ